MSTAANPQVVALRTRELFDQLLDTLSRRTDRMFAWLTGLEWMTGIIFAIWISHRAWSGEFSRIHFHVWTAIILGGIIAGLPIALVILSPGTALTRHLVAASQMLMAGLLVHLTGGRIETHFVFFGLLAFLAFYHDWKVLLTATLVTGLDHFLRGIFWPLSIFGVLATSPWRAAEHAGWVLFEVIFLVGFIRQSRNRTWVGAERQALLEDVNNLVAVEVSARTADLTNEIEERVKAQTRLHLQNEISALLGGDAPIDYICQHTLRVIAETFGWNWGAVWEVNPHMQVMRLTSSWRKSDDLRDFEALSRGTLLRREQGVPGRVWASGDCYWIGDLSLGIGSPRLEIATSCGLKAAFAFPVSQEHDVIAVFEFWNDELLQPEGDMVETFAAMGRAIGTYFAHKQDEKTLRESERRYRLMFDNNPHPMWVYDLETLRFHAVNRSAIEKYGYSAEEFQNLTIIGIAGRRTWY